MAEPAQQKMRVLLCIGIVQNFFDLPESRIPEVLKVFKRVFGEIADLPGLEVIGTFDDDRVMVGHSPGWPWTSYILADVDDLSTVIAACNLFRTTPVDDGRLWKYGRIEARVGRELNLKF